MLLYLGIRFPHVNVRGTNIQTIATYLTKWLRPKCSKKCVNYWHSAWLMFLRSLSSFSSLPPSFPPHSLPPFLPSPGLETQPIVTQTPLHLPTTQPPSFFPREQPNCLWLMAPPGGINGELPGGCFPQPPAHGDNELIPVVLTCWFIPVTVLLICTAQSWPSLGLSLHPMGGERGFRQPRGRAGG